MWGIHRSAVNSPHKGQWCRALSLSLICTWINGYLNNRKAGDLRHHRPHYDVIVMFENWGTYRWNVWVQNLTMTTFGSTRMILSWLNMHINNWHTNTSYLDEFLFWVWFYTLFTKFIFLGDWIITVKWNLHVFVHICYWLFGWFNPLYTKFMRIKICLFYLGYKWIYVVCIMDFLDTRCWYLKEIWCYPITWLANTRRQQASVQQQASVHHRTSYWPVKPGTHFNSSPPWTKWPSFRRQHF